MAFCSPKMKFKNQYKKFSFQKMMRQDSKIQRFPNLILKKMYSKNQNRKQSKKCMILTKSQNCELGKSVKCGKINKNRIQNNRTFIYIIDISLSASEQWQGQFDNYYFYVKLLIQQRMHTISFKQVIDQHKKGQDAAHEGLFTRLKHNIMKQSQNNEANDLKPIYTTSAHSLLKEYELQFEILKLEKANYVVQMHMKTGAPIKAVIQQIMIDLEEQIQAILYQKQNKLVQTKANSHLQQTFGQYDEPSSTHLKTEEGSNKANNSMKNVEFTLGNREISSAKSNNNKGYGGDEVSQFLVNNKILIGSKGIKEKVMGRKQR